MQLIPDIERSYIIIIAIGPVRMFDNFRRFGRIRSVISVGSVRFGSVTGFIHSRSRKSFTKRRNTVTSNFDLTVVP